MPLRNSQQAYGAIARFAHWATGAVDRARLAARHVQELFSRRDAARRQRVRPHVARPRRHSAACPQARLARARPAAAGDSRRPIRAVARPRRQGRASAALRAADRDADPRHRAAILARPRAAGVRPVRYPLAVGHGSRVLPPDASGCTSSPPTRSSSSRSATPRRPCSTIGRCATARSRACCRGSRGKPRRSRGPSSPRTPGLDPGLRLTGDGGPSGLVLNARVKPAHDAAGFFDAARPAPPPLRLPRAARAGR